MTIDINSIPPLPSRNQAGFSDQVDAFVTWFLNTFPTEFNDSIVALNLNSTNGTSSTSNSIGTGAKTFTANTAKSWQPGMWVLIADTAAPSTNYMAGPVTSYNSGTGSLVVNVAVAVGSGTKTAWIISQSAPGGAGFGANAFTGSQWFAKGADIASAATTNVWSTDGNLVHVTGTTGITSLGTAPQAGAFKLVVFDGVLTLTHSANLNLQDSENFTTEAGDIALVIADTTTQLDVIFWRKVKQASTTRKGEVELATAAEFNAGTDPARVPSVQTIRENGWVYQAEYTTTGGTTIPVTGIPSWAQDIEAFFELSTNGTSDLIVQLGDAGGYENTGYDSVYTQSAGGVATATQTTGFGIAVMVAADTVKGKVKLSLQDASDFTWYNESITGRSAAPATVVGQGTKSLSAALNSFQFTTAAGANTFDVVKVRVRYR